MLRPASRLASGTALSFLMSFGLLSVPALAQTAEEEDGTFLGTIVISAEEQIKQALGVSQISEEDMKKTPVVNDVAEIIRKMPGVNLTGTTSTGQRGNNRQIDIRGMGPENTLILIDGKPVASRNSVKMGRGGERDTRGDSNWVPAEMIERIEVIRGPAAARYGSGAAGGVVNIITKRPETMTGQVGLSWNIPDGDDEGGTKRANFMFATPLTERLSFRIYGNYNKSEPDALDINDEAEAGTGGTTPLAGREGVENKDINALLSWRIAENHELDFELGFSRQGNIYAGDTQLGGIGTIPASLWGEETNRLYRRTFALTHRGEYGFGESYSYLQFEQTDNTRLCEGAAGGGEGAITNCVDTDGDGTNDAPGFKTIELLNVSAKTEWILPLMLGGKNSALTLGAEYRGEFMDDPVSIGTTVPPVISDPDIVNDPSLRDPKTDQQMLGLYAEANIEWSEALTLTPGLRYDYSDDFGSNLSPSLNAEYVFNENWTMKAGVARAFKAPNLFQLNPGYVYTTRGNGCPVVDGVRLSGPCFVIGNPDLDAEISVNTEIGIAYRDDEDLNVSFTWFHNDYKNKIQSGQIQENPGATANRLFRWENTGPAVIEGIEGNFSRPLGEQFALNANFTYMLESEIKATRQPLSLVPDYTINASLDWQARDDLLFTLSATHYGPIPVNMVSSITNDDLTDGGTVTLNERGSYTLFNVNMKWDVNDSVYVTAGVSNLFDKQLFRTDTSGGGNTYNEPGRAIYVGVNTTF